MGYSTYLAHLQNCKWKILHTHVKVVAIYIHKLKAHYVQQLLPPVNRNLYGTKGCKHAAAFCDQYILIMQSTPSQQYLAILSLKFLTDYIIIFLQLKRVGTIKSMLILTFKINYNV